MAYLTDQQRTFVQAYIRTGFDRRAACKEAGYSEKNADSIACKLLKKSQIRAEIDRLLSQVDEKTVVEAEEIIAELRKIAFAKPSAGVNNSDRLRALELLGKTKALFSDALAISRGASPETPQTSEDEQAAIDAAARAYKLRLSASDQAALPAFDPYSAPVEIDTDYLKGA